ncbi:hypothetical protein BS47DRAFT_1360305 [Hydnum rufescens UP504]|uniref:Uncharacterized protein n=1 Tax=Hydnum rufescens UP504 TaxID=1448309 RepID=A0A9P6B312_9AGAM|nr:hypothetical protein BS47DRAFT_1360305 [Hydnum rufescens UP504]
MALITYRNQSKKSRGENGQPLMLRLSLKQHSTGEHSQTSTGKKRKTPSSKNDSTEEHSGSLTGKKRKTPTVKKTKKSSGNAQTANNSTASYVGQTNMDPGTPHETSGEMAEGPNPPNLLSDNPGRPIADTASILLSKLRVLANKLPSSVPLGSSTDPWGTFFLGTSVNDQAYIAAFELSAEPDPSGDWEACNQSIHKCFDYHITKEDLVARIRRGPMGVLAFLGYLDFMHRRGVDLTPLHERLELLIDALQEWSDWADQSLSSSGANLFLEEDSDHDEDSATLNAPPAVSTSLYRKQPVLDFGVDCPSPVTIPKQSKKISPFDDGDPKYDFGVFGFDKYNPFPARDSNQPYAKGPISNNDLEILAQSHTSRPCFFKYAISTPTNGPPQYNAFVHSHRQTSTTKGDAFLSEAAVAWSDLKAHFHGDDEGWKAKCKELVEEYDKEKADLVKTANQWNEGHVNLMEVMMEKMAQQARTAGENDIHVATFMVSGRSHSSAAMRQNKVMFGTPETWAWFLAKLRPPGAPADDKLALRMIFSDFYSSIAQYRNDTASANASKALTMLELRDANELRALMASVGISIGQYRSKFPWGTFWFILFRHNKCLTNWLDPKRYSNALHFKSKTKDEWCLLLRQFKVEGEKSKNPVLIPRIHESIVNNDPEETDLSKIVLATGVDGASVITGDMIPAIVDSGLAKRKSKAMLATTPSWSDNMAMNT